MIDPAGGAEMVEQMATDASAETPKELANIWGRLRERCERQAPTGAVVADTSLARLNVMPTLENAGWKTIKKRLRELNADVIASRMEMRRRGGTARSDC